MTISLIKGINYPKQTGPPQKFNCPLNLITSLDTACIKRASAIIVKLGERERKKLHPFKNLLQIKI